MVERHERECQLGLEAGDPKRGVIELDFLFVVAVRRVIAGDQFQGSVDHALDDLRAMVRRPQRRVHLEAGIVGRPDRQFPGTPTRTNDFAVLSPELGAPRDRGIGEDEMVGAGFAGDGETALARFAEQADTFAGTDVLAMDMSAGEFGQLDVAGHHQLLARGRPAPEPEHGAPETLVHDPIAHQRVVLAMIHQGQVEHGGILERASHQFVVLHAMTVVGDGHHPGLGQQPDRRQFLTRQSPADRTGHMDIHARLAGRLLANQGHGSGVIDRRCSVRHADHRGKPSPRGRHRAGRDGFLGGLPRFAQVDMGIEEAGAYDLARCIQPLDLRRGTGRCLGTERGDASLADQQIGHGINVIGGIDDPTSNDKQGAHAARSINSLRCRGKITPGTAVFGGIERAPTPGRSGEHSMPARKYLLTLERFAALEPTLRKGVRVPNTPPGSGLPPRVVRYLRDFGAHKRGSNRDSTWRLPGYRILSRLDLLRR